MIKLQDTLISDQERLHKILEGGTLVITHTRLYEDTTGIFPNKTISKTLERYARMLQQGTLISTQDSTNI